jgi:hypothetical protein
MVDQMGMAACRGKIGGMIEKEAFGTVANQMMTADAVELEGRRYPVKRSSSQRLRMVTFVTNGSEFTAIEQNPEKPSRWGQLAREGRKVVQFKSVKTNRFVAVAVDGQVRGYGKS